MKRNTMARKMKKLTKISADCMEALQDMSYDGTFTRKEINMVVRKMTKADKKWDRLWKHNVSPINIDMKL